MGRSTILMINEQLLTVDEIAFILNVSTQTVRKLIKKKQLIAIKVGKNYRISWDNLNDYISRTI
ncbi:helix-turn-helix domain-containing protein [Clostridium sp. C1]|nr:helix-turn-helix domain-containing protein [Clostridium sp. C1]